MAELCSASRSEEHTQIHRRMFVTVWSTLSASIHYTIEARNITRLVSLYSGVSDGCHHARKKP